MRRTACSMLLAAMAAFATNTVAQDSEAPAIPVVEPTPGPYAVNVASFSTLPTHTVYVPQELSAFGGGNLLPIVSWGNGGCARVGTAFEKFLTQIASHGYLAVAIGPKDAKPRRPGSGEAVAPPTGAPSEVDDHLLLEAIDWAIAQNGDRSSALHGKLDTTRIAVMGMSCGGLQTIAVSHDPRITTSVVWNSGTLPPGAPTPGGKKLSDATKDSLKQLHAPIAYIIGGPSDIAYPNAEDDFARITTVPVFKANLDVGHGGTYLQPGGGWFGAVAVAWLDWQLKKDAAAATWFVGPDCKLCKEPLWHVEKKGMQ